MLHEKDPRIRELEGLERIGGEFRSEFGVSWFGLLLKMKRVLADIDDFVADHCWIPPDEVGKTGLNYIAINGVFDRSAKLKSEYLGGRVLLTRQKLEERWLEDERLMRGHA